MRNEIKNCNRLLREELGSAPNGMNLFKWERTDKLFAFERQGSEEKKTPSGVIYFEPTWTKYAWAEHHGVRWVLCSWRAVDRDQWYLEMGHSWPWPSQGEYQMVGSGMLPKGEEPDERVTRFAIAKVKENLPKTFKQHREELLAEVEAKQKPINAKIEGEIEETFFPFNQIPGTKGSASLPTPKFLRQ